MTITTPPAGLPASTTHTGDIPLDRLDRAPTPTTPASPGSPASSRGGALPPRRMSSELGGLSARRNPDAGPSRSGDASLAPRLSLEQLRRPVRPPGDPTPPSPVALTRTSSATSTTSTTSTASGTLRTGGVGLDAQHPVHEAPAREAPAREVPVHEAPVHEASVHEASVHEVPVHEAHVHEASVHEVPVHEAPVHEAPVHEVPEPPHAPAHAAPDGHGHAPREAGALSFFLMQNVRHALPVAGVRTVVQGVIAPELARAVVSHPTAAVAAQTALTAYSLGRRIVSQIHSESSAQVADQAFAGDSAQRNGSVPRRIWQGIQSAGIAGGDFAALALTIASRSNPALAGAAQAAAAIQVIAHLQAQFREALRPAINTVHVGNGDPNVTQPPEGRNLRPADVTWTMRGTFGAAAAVIDMGTQLLMQRTLGGQPAWQAARGLAIGAGAIAGVGNMLTSSVEDHLVDTASALRMRETTRHGRGSETHVRHIHIDLRNPFTRNELGRQAERADTRIFNTMVPGLIALGVVQALQSTLSQPGVSANERQAAQAGVHAAVAGLVGGALLALTVASYQLNDTVRSRNAAQRAAAQRAQP